MIDSVESNQPEQIGIALSARHIARETPSFSEGIDTAVIGAPRGVVALLRELRFVFLAKKAKITGVTEKEKLEFDEYLKEKDILDNKLKGYRQAKGQGEFEGKNIEAKTDEKKLIENQKNHTYLGSLPAVREIAYFENAVYDQIKEQVISQKDKLRLKDEKEINAETIRRMEERINQLSINFVKGRATSKRFFEKALNEIGSFIPSE
jgi:hypothetical protein